MQREFDTVHMMCCGVFTSGQGTVWQSYFAVGAVRTEFNLRTKLYKND